MHAHMLQFSGAIWYPMVYELPQAAKTAFGKQKRDRQFDRTWRYIDDLKASLVFPIAGPPCFLDDELWQFNDIFGDEGNIFPDQWVFMARVREGRRRQRRRAAARLRGDADRGRVRRPTHPVARRRRVLRRQGGSTSRSTRERKRPVIEAEKASWRHPEIDVLKEMKRRIEPLLDESIYLAKGVGGPVRFDLVGYDGESIESIVVDFPGKEVRRATPTRRCATGSAPSGRWSSTCCTSTRSTGSTRCSCPAGSRAARIGQYNEFVYAFFKCLSEERLQYAEGWYDEHERTTDAEDITLDDWVVQRRCPHLKADLTRFGIVDGDTLHLPAARLEVRPAQRPLPDQRRPPDPRPPRR